MNLFQKGLLAFAVVILIAVLAVALLVGQRTEAQFRSYAALYSNRAVLLADSLISYYDQNRGWEGLQATLPDLTSSGRGIGQHRGQGAGGTAWNYRVSDASGTVIADSNAAPGGQLSTPERDSAVPLLSGDEIVGYLLPDAGEAHTVTLDAPAEAFLSQMRRALWIGAGVAFLAALLLAGVLTRSIVAPVRRLSGAAHAIAQGNLTVRAAVHGRDEVAELADTFNDMAASLERAENARRAQTADIAHELRNPLAVLQGTLEALADGIYAPTPEALQPALDQVRTLNRLVDDLRTLALADAGQLVLELGPVEIEAVVNSVMDAFRDTLRARGVTLAAQVDGPLPAIEGDYERLTQVMNNILSNAARYLPAGCEVRVHVSPDADGVTVRIADNGPGIPDAELPYLFERFWRGEPSRSRKTGGAGLGLAIARRILEAHRGRMWAEKTLGGGLTLGFWLPAEQK